jgi:hypothetical protein
MSSAPAKTPQEQINYANLLFYGCWSGLLLMVITYVLYVLGIMSPKIPLDKIIVYWKMPVHDYLQQAHIPTGWGWAGLLGYGDFLNFLGIALLGGMTIIAFVPLIPAYIKKKDPLFAILAAIEVLVLSLAASGILGGGAH